jgi:hypothetical protein
MVVAERSGFKRFRVSLREGLWAFALFSISERQGRESREKQKGLGSQPQAYLQEGVIASV